jgi:hypothetical protein
MNDLVGKKEVRIIVCETLALFGDELEEEDQPVCIGTQRLVDGVQFFEFDSFDTDFGDERSKDSRIRLYGAPLGH